jgi:uncharacterized protein (DUF305 family)
MPPAAQPVPSPSPTVVQPGAPGQPSREIDASKAPVPHITFTPADVSFMQGMIGHHAQALEMTELLKTRTASEGMKLLAQRIEVSQTDEIRFMKRWLTEHGQPLPSEHAHHMPGGMMPGMLTPDQMAELAAAKGEAFDALFLKFMIQHHEGALVMVKDLFASDGAAQDGDVNAFASDVVADQQMEIDRMSGMLRELQK